MQAMLSPVSSKVLRLNKVNLINVSGAVHTLRSGLPHVEKVDGRLAVILCHGAGDHALLAPYCASKHALTGLCRSLHGTQRSECISYQYYAISFVESEIRVLITTGHTGSRPRAHQKD